MRAMIRQVHRCQPFTRCHAGVDVIDILQQQKHEIFPSSILLRIPKMGPEHSKYRSFLRGKLFSTRGSEASQVLSRAESRLTANLETLRRTDQNLEMLRRTDLAEPAMEFREFQLFGEVIVAAL